MAGMCERTGSTRAPANPRHQAAGQGVRTPTRQQPGGLATPHKCANSSGHDSKRSRRVLYHTGSRPKHHRRLFWPGAVTILTPRNKETPCKDSRPLESARVQQKQTRRRREKGWHARTQAGSPIACWPWPWRASVCTRPRDSPGEASGTEQVSLRENREPALSLMPVK